MREAVIVSTARTGLAKSFRGGFNDTEAPAMGGHVVRAAVEWQALIRLKWMTASLVPPPNRALRATTWAACAALPVVSRTRSLEWQSSGSAPRA